MIFNEFTIPFLVVTILGEVNAQANEIPICDPPALKCSLLKKSVCEWSDSGKPVWACRGFFDKVNNGPKRPQHKSDGDGNDEDVIIGTYEYQIPKVSKKSVLNDSESDEVQFLTYTYPISKDSKSTASKVITESEVKIGTYALPVPSGRSSSASKVESESEVQIGTNSFSFPGNKSDVRGESNSDAQVKSYLVPSVKKGSASKVETDVDVQFGSYALPLTSGKSTGTSHSDSDSEDVHFETYTIQVPIKNKSSESKVEPDSEVHLETGKLHVTGNKSVDVKHAGDNANVEFGTYTYHNPSITTTTSEHEAESKMHVGTHTSPVKSGKSSSSQKVESEPEMQVETYTVALPKNNSSKPVHIESDSDVQIVTYTYKIPSSKKGLSSQKTSDDIQMGTYAITSKNSSGTEHSDSDLSHEIGTHVYQIPSNKISANSPADESESEVLLNTFTYNVSSGKSSGSSPTDSESKIQFGTHQVASSQNTVTAEDDSGSKYSVAAGDNQANIMSSDSQVSPSSDVKIEATSSMVNDALSQYNNDSQRTLLGALVSNAQRGSQSQDHARTKVYSVPSALKDSTVQHGSESNEQATSQCISSRNSGSSSRLGIGSVAESVKSEKICGDTPIVSPATANGAVQINQASAMHSLRPSSSVAADASSLNGFRTAGHQGSQTIGLEQANFGRGMYTSSRGTTYADGTFIQQHSLGVPTVNNPQQYHSRNGNLGSIHASGTYSQTGNPLYIRGDLSGNYGNTALWNHRAIHAAGNGMTNSDTVRVTGDRTLTGIYPKSSQTNDNQASFMGILMTPYHLTSDAAATISGGPNQQHQAHAEAGFGSFFQNHGTRTQTRQPVGYPNDRYNVYQNLERGSALVSPTRFSGSGMYDLPQLWTPLIDMGLRGYSTNSWLVGHKPPLINPALNGVAPQNMGQSANSEIYRFRNINSASNAASMSSASSLDSPWFYIPPFAQYFSKSRALGTQIAAPPPCNYCKELMSMLGGPEICDLLEPIIREFFNKILELCLNRLK